MESKSPVTVCVATDTVVPVTTRVCVIVEVDAAGIFVDVKVIVSAERVAVTTSMLGASVVVMVLTGWVVVT
jgi:hypothetical protein